MDKIYKFNANRLAQIMTIRRSSLNILPMEKMRRDFNNMVSNYIDLGEISPISALDIAILDDERLATLRHELSDHFQARANGEKFRDRSTDEAQALAEWERANRPPLSFGLFIDQLGELNRRLTAGSACRRRAIIGTAPDRAGVSVEFPSVDETEPQLRWLWEQVHGSEAQSNCPVLVAATALVILTNAHLFTDGNGRLSRAIFNHVLHRGGMPLTVYIPMYEFAFRSRGGFLIRVRQAELRGQWSPLIDYVLDLLTICCEVGAESHGRR